MPTMITMAPSRTRQVEKMAKACGLPSPPGMPSKLMPKRPTMTESRRPPPPMTAKLCWIRRLFWASFSRALLCMTSWTVNRRSRTSSCSSNISRDCLSTLARIWRAVSSFRCVASSWTISWRAWSDHLIRMTWELQKSTPLQIIAK